MKKIFLLGLIMVLMACSVFANCYQYGCCESTGTYSAFAYNYPNPTELIASNYTKCTIPTADFTPIVADLNNDLLMDVILISGSTLEVYSPDCALEFLNLVGEVVTAQPVAMNENGNAYPELYVTTATQLKVYEYNSVLGSLSNTKNFDYSVVEKLPITELTCMQMSTPLTARCLGFSSGGKNLTYFDIGGSTGITHLGDYFSTSIGTGNFFNNYPGWPNMVTNNADNYYSLFCGKTLSTLYTCYVIDQGGVNVFNLTYMPIQSLGAVTFGSASVGKIGTLKAFFVSFESLYSSSYTGTTSVQDLSGNPLFNVSVAPYNAGTAGQEHSNWAVADYNKDGQNEACLAYSIYAAGNNHTFKCFNAYGSVTNYITNRSSCGFDINNIALGDFDNTADTLGIATHEGIYYEDGGGGCDMWLNISDWERLQGFPIVSNTIIGSGIPMLIYADNSGAGYIVAFTEMLGGCNNSICDDFENAFTCPEDCHEENVTLYSPGEGCTLNTECASGLCEYGFCVLLGQSAGCTLNSQCLSGVCSNGKCTNPGFVAGITQAKDSWLGTDPNTGNFLALFFMIGIPIILVFITKSPIGAIIGVPIYFALAVFFTLIGWLSPFILVLSIFGGLVIIVLAVVMNPGSG